MHARLRSPNNLLILHQIIEPDFTCLAEEIAKPHPDMNIAAFTVSEKSTNIIIAQPTVFIT